MENRARCAHIAALALSAIGIVATSARAAEPPKTIGLVLTHLGYSIHETEGGKTECPEGFNAETLVQFRAQFPTEEARNRQFAHTMDVQGRGPNGINTTYNPEFAGPEPVPGRYVLANIGTGLDLDGTADGRETEKTCAHENLTSPTGEKGIDNQLYRVIGCVPGWRANGFHSGFWQGTIKDNVANRTLIEITGVDDEKNDDHVDVAIYKGRDPMIEGAGGEVQAFQSQRIDANLLYSAMRTTGRIENGVLTTTPFDMVLPFHMIGVRGSIQMHDMRLRLELTNAGAKGMMGGYSDIEHWYQFLARGPSYADLLGGISGPTIYQGLVKFADGDKDPQTKQCKAISTAYNVKFTRVFVVHPPNPRTASAGANQVVAKE